MSRNTRPTRAGLKGLRPRPPKVILATPIATSDPITTIHHGIDDGRLNASSRPVTAAERFDTVHSPWKRNFWIRNSITTQLTTAMADTVSTSTPCTHVDTANAGSIAMSTSRMIERVDCALCTCGDGATKNLFAMIFISSFIICVKRYFLA